MSRALLSVLVMGAVTFLIRAVPVTIFRKKIKSRFIRSFLYYVPYVTLAVMTFPAITLATRTPVSGYAALAAGGVCAFRKNASLPLVASVCCLTVFLTEWLLLP